MNGQQNLMEFVGWLATAAAGIYLLIRFVDWWRSGGHRVLKPTPGVDRSLLLIVLCAVVIVFVVWQAITRGAT
jgi:hypothetical protein